MKRPGRRNLKSTGLLRNYATVIRRTLLICLVSVLVFCGCNKTQQPAENSASSAPPAAPAAVPPSNQASQPVAPAPAPAAAPAPTPEPLPPPPPPKVYTVPSGTALVVQLSQTLSSKDNNVGDPFSGSLAQSVRVKGVTVLRAGTPVSGTVIAAKGQGRFKGQGDLGVELNRVGPYSVTTQAYEKTVSGKGKRSAAMIGGGGGGGALIGGLAGGGKGALIGGLVGAGAGTVGAAVTGNKAVSIPAESVVTFTLSSPVTVTEKPKSGEE